MSTSCSNKLYMACEKLVVPLRSNTLLQAEKLYSNKVADNKLVTTCQLVCQFVCNNCYNLLQDWSANILSAKCEVFANCPLQ